MAKMKKYESFERFHSDQSPEHQQIIAKLAELVGSVRPELDTSVKWGNGVWLHDGSPVLYAHCEKDHVQFGFFNGSALDDPDGVLVGSGKYVRHIKLHSHTDIDESMLRPLIGHAVKIIK